MMWSGERYLYDILSRAELFDNGSLKMHFRRALKLVCYGKHNVNTVFRLDALNLNTQMI